MTPLCQPLTLTGRHVRLEPLSAEHCAGLQEATRDGELWKLWVTSVPAPEAMAAEIERRQKLLAQASMLPFTVFDLRAADGDHAAPGGRIAGMTTFMNIDNVHRRVEIGSTWYAASTQRSPVNTEAKLLLLTHAFETLDCIAVEFRTHRFNIASRRAIERLGAQLDGMLRAHSRAANDTLRDTAVYSITAAEWPTVKAHLSWQLQRPR